MADDEDVWFAPKRCGYGAGRPVTWQGWALVVGFAAATAVLSHLLMPRHPVPFVATVLAMAAATTVVSARHTRGGWRWRR